MGGGWVRKTFLDFMLAVQEREKKSQYDQNSGTIKSTTLELDVMGYS